MPDRSHAVALLEEWVENEGLRKHMYAVEAAVRHYARMRGAPTRSCGASPACFTISIGRSTRISTRWWRSSTFARQGYDEEILHAILAHRSGFTGVEPESELDKVLVACDELSGLVFAACLVRPTGIDDLKPKSVTKKLKDKAFAAGVSRDEVAHGIELIGLDRAEHIQNVIDGLRAIGAELGIRGEDLAEG